MLLTHVCVTSVKREELEIGYGKGPTSARLALRADNSICAGFPIRKGAACRLKVCIFYLIFTTHLKMRKFTRKGMKIFCTARLTGRNIHGRLIFSCGLYSFTRQETTINMYVRGNMPRLDENKLDSSSLENKPFCYAKQKEILEVDHTKCNEQNCLWLHMPLHFIINTCNVRFTRSKVGIKIFE